VTSQSVSESPGVGRPRSERARLAVLEAAADLLVEGGLSAATIEAVAARAGVSKVTIYRWWPTRGAVAIDAYFHRYRRTSVVVDTGDVAADLLAQIRLLEEAFRGRAGELMAELIGRTQADASLAEDFAAGWLQPRRTATADLLRAAVARGEIRPDVDLPTLLDQLFAPIYWRLLMQHGPLDEAFAAALVDNLLGGVGPR
jgi:AcrR family transcriptional regulator